MIVVVFTDSPSFRYPGKSTTTALNLTLEKLNVNASPNVTDVTHTENYFLRGLYTAFIRMVTYTTAVSAVVLYEFISIISDAVLPNSSFSVSPIIKLVANSFPGELIAYKMLSSVTLNVAVATVTSLLKAIKKININSKPSVSMSPSTRVRRLNMFFISKFMFIFYEQIGSQNS